MINESRLTIKKVFDCFDADNSGYVDGRELKNMSR
jgi:Ca2+-binding EF-hand superfamily protein